MYFGTNFFLSKIKLKYIKKKYSGISRRENVPQSGELKAIRQLCRIQHGGTD
jgi:hypothetical protein